VQDAGLAFEVGDTRRFAETGKSRWRGMDAEIAKERLQALHAAKSLQGLGQLRSLGLHKLTGSRSGSWAHDDQRTLASRLRFRTATHDVEIVDHH
jgi:proteic killer suppression protein